MDLKEEYKKHYGRNPRKDWDEERIIEAILNKDPEFKYEKAEEPKEEPKQEPKEEPKVKQAKVVEKGKDIPPSKGNNKRTKQYRVFLGDQERWLTAPVIKQALRMDKTKNKVSFPENTDFQTDATINKCKNC